MTFDKMITSKESVHRCIDEVYENLKPSLGFKCIADTKPVLAFLEKNRASLCYVCRIISNSRNESYGKYDQTEYDFIIGGSRIIK